MTQELKDSGQRRVFKTGAVRDRGELKPRPDLISPHAQMREGMIHALGSEKYDLRNWEKGMPISECLASAQRHIEQYKRGDTDEDHLAQARWNLGAMIHFEEEIKAGRLDSTLNDLPRYAADNLPLYALNVPGLVALKPGDTRINPVTLQEETYVKFGGHIAGTTCVVHPTAALNSYISEAPDVMRGLDMEISIQDKERVPKLQQTFYICGPMRGIVNLNFPLFDEVAAIARASGLRVISPAEVDRANGIDPINNPDSAGEKAEKDPNFLRDIVKRDCAAIIGLDSRRGDGLILLDGWTRSVGGRAEIALALWLGLNFKRTMLGYECGIYLYDVIPSWVSSNLFRQL